MFDLFTPPPETRPQPFTCDFHDDNPHVYEAFKKQIFKAINAGKTRISHIHAMSVIRWEMWITTEDDDGFKINNNAVAFYPRKFVLQFPEHADKFDLRRSHYDTPFLEHLLALDSLHLKSLIERIESHYE